MKYIKIYGIMVIYNKCLSDSVTYQCLKNEDIELVICDNSTKENDNADIAAHDGRVYLSMNGNKGLSYAYNKALEKIFEDGKVSEDDWVCIFDDDTGVPKEYFEALRNSKSQLVLPIVKDDIGIMSPVRMEKCIAKRFSAIEEINSYSACLSGINSAMAIRAKVLKEYRYNEEMFLDYIDHKFIMDMRERNIYPDVMPVVIHQRFSAVEDSKDAAKRRFRIQKKDLRIFYKKNLWIYYYIVIKKHLKLVIKYKDIRMLIC